LKKILHRDPYAAARRAAYPPIGDQLDAIMKLATQLWEQGVPMSDDVTQWISACQKVKDHYPK
jgi:hypothetical protein